MLGNVAKRISLLGNKSILLKRYNLTQAVLNNIRSKRFTISSKDSKDLRTTAETDDIDETSQPIKFSSTKAATMRVNEYRNPYGDSVPWYQSYAVMLSLAVFLIYFCILREENDIDLMLYNDLGDTLNTVSKDDRTKHHSS
ncbi:uncharacterized protein [Linepithema humile]|uniref:uncharacterized protein n=1 Tax=Linepithema humile TaxID=83485 RepID=UPI0006235FAC|nr:PREDICTED: uncharacterized protein LOC105679676 [Linepithema humile]